MQQKIKQEYRDILIFFLTFGIMFSYYYFAPVVFLAIFIQMIVEIKNHPYFIAVQFHPEFKSRPDRPQPLFVGLVKATKNRI